MLGGGGGGGDLPTGHLLLMASRDLSSCRPAVCPAPACQTADWSLAVPLASRLPPAPPGPELRPLVATVQLSPARQSRPPELVDSVLLRNSSGAGPKASASHSASSSSGGCSGCDLQGDASQSGGERWTNGSEERTPEDWLRQGGARAVGLVRGGQLAEECNLRQTFHEGRPSPPRAAPSRQVSAAGLAATGFGRRRKSREARDEHCAESEIIRTQ